MENLYILSVFNTRDKSIYSIGRQTEEEIYKEMLCAVNSIPHPPSQERIDYRISATSPARNEHNAYVCEEDGTEWFFTTSLFILK